MSRTSRLDRISVILRDSGYLIGDKMAVERFNDMDSAQGPVARTGSLAGSEPSGARPSATGTPSIAQADGTGSPRANTQTFRSAGNTTPSGGKGPTAPQSFNGGSV